MKITTFILITVILQAGAATTLAQKVTLHEKNVALVDVFNKIRNQTGYDFAFSTELMENARPVTIDVKNEELTDVLTKLFKGQNLEFSLSDKIVTVKPKEEGLIDRLKDQIKAELAQVTVTGKVVDETGQPLPGVTVKIKATGGATATDANGRFSITVPDDKTILVFSSIGYEPQELAAKDIPPGSTITLKASQTALTEVQVYNKGYYFEKKELSTGDVSIVGSKTLEEQPVFDPLQALIGQVSGLNIQQSSGMPGSYSTIRIRGVNSIANGTVPLYIIDGVPYNSQSLSSNQIINALGFGNVGALTQKGTQPNAGGQSPFSALNMTDIESIEVLKDADATAIYGSRGANGVILITTKKGKVGDTRVNIDMSQGVGQVGHFIDMLNTQQYLQMRRQAFTNSGLAIPSIIVTPTNTNYDVNGVWDTTRYTNWQKAMIGRTAHYTNMQASISGGNANTQFLISTGYSRQTTVFPGDFEDQKGSVHLNLTHSSNDQKFNVMFSTSYVHDNNLLPSVDFTQYITFAPDAPAMYNPDGSINWQYYNGTSTFSNNPAGQLLTTSTAVTNNLISNMNLSYRLFPGLLIKSSFSYNYDEMNENIISPNTAYPAPNNTNPNFNDIELSNTIFQTWALEPQLTYTKKVSKGAIDGLIGGTFQQNLQQNNNFIGIGFTSPALINDIGAAASPSFLPSTYVQYRYISVYGRIALNWEEKYLLNVTARRDGSSRFGYGKQFGDFGAVGVGWIFTKEKNIQNAAPWLNFGKLRASYGTTGNDQLTDYQYLSTYSVNSKTYQNISGLAPTSLTNPYYAWEVVKKLEGGLDLGFLQDRIDLSIDYYRNRTDNQLVGYPLSSVTGFTTVQYNLPAVVQNTGLEAQLTTQNFKNKDFSWSTSVNFTLPNNKLVSYPGLSTSSYKNTYIVGQSLFVARRTVYTGVNPQTGLYTVATANLNGSPSLPQDLATFVTVTQKCYSGLQNTFTYKNLSLDIFVQFVKQLGPSYQSQAFFNTPGFSNANQPTAVLNDVWTKPGDISKVQAYRAIGGNYTQLVASTAGFTDNSFIRIKNVALYYKLPTSWQNRLHLHNTRIYIQGQNLYTWTKSILLDPESPGMVVPPLRVIMAGLNTSF